MSKLQGTDKKDVRAVAASLAAESSSNGVMREGVDLVLALQSVRLVVACDSVMDMVNKIPGLVDGSMSFNDALKIVKEIASPDVERTVDSTVQEIEEKEAKDVVEEPAESVKK